MAVGRERADGRHRQALGRLPRRHRDLASGTRIALGRFGRRHRGAATAGSGRVAAFGRLIRAGCRWPAGARGRNLRTCRRPTRAHRRLVRRTLGRHLREEGRPAPGRRIRRTNRLQPRALGLLLGTHRLLDRALGVHLRALGLLDRALGGICSSRCTHRRLGRTLGGRPPGGRTLGGHHRALGDRTGRPHRAFGGDLRAVGVLLRALGLHLGRTGRLLDRAGGRRHRALGVTLRAGRLLHRAGGRLRRAVGRLLRAIGRRPGRTLGGRAGRTALGRLVHALGREFGTECADPRAPGRILRAGGRDQRALGQHRVALRRASGRTGGLLNRAARRHRLVRADGRQFRTGGRQRRAVRRLPRAGGRHRRALGRHGRPRADAGQPRAGRRRVRRTLGRDDRAVGRVRGRRATCRLVAALGRRIRADGELAGAIGDSRSRALGRVARASGDVGRIRAGRVDQRTPGRRDRADRGLGRTKRLLDRAHRRIDRTTRGRPVRRRTECRRIRTTRLRRLRRRTPGRQLRAPRLLHRTGGGNIRRATGQRPRADGVSRRADCRGLRAAGLPDRAVRRLCRAVCRRARADRLDPRAGGVVTRTLGGLVRHDRRLTGACDHALGLNRRDDTEGVNLRACGLLDRTLGGDRVAGADRGLLRAARVVLRAVGELDRADRDPAATGRVRANRRFVVAHRGRPRALGLNLRTEGGPTGTLGPDNRTPGLIPVDAFGRPVGTRGDPLRAQCELPRTVGGHPRAGRLPFRAHGDPDDFGTLGIQDRTAGHRLRTDRVIARTLGGNLRTEGRIGCRAHAKRLLAGAFRQGGRIPSKRCARTGSG